MKKRAVAFAAIWLIAGAIVWLLPGCYGRDCDGSISFYGRDAGEGRMLDENTWESNPIDGEWLDFPGQRHWVFDIPALGGRTPNVLDGYLAANKKPAGVGSFTEGAGNLIVYFNPGPNHIEVHNDSCSSYFLRLVARASPQPPPVVVISPEAGPIGGDASP